MKVEYEIIDGYALVLTGESESDCAALQEFAEAGLSGSPIDIREVQYSADEGGTVHSLAVVVTERAQKFTAGFGHHGWSDRFSDEMTVGGVPYQLDHELVVRPSALSGHGPLHGFVATVRVTLRSWDRNGDNGHGAWSLPRGATVVYHGEHASLGAGVRAARKAYDRSLTLREGPKDE